MHALTVRLVFILSGVVLAMGTGCAAHTPDDEATPNLIVIMSDDHAAQAVSSYGSQINQTPNIDRLAQEGIRFTNAFCTNSICSPSRAVILTGVYSHVNGVETNRTPFDGSQKTFPKLLQQAGYQTALIGKWHLQSKPTGFDYWHVLPGQGAYYDPEMIEMGVSKKQEGYVTDIVTDQALRWLEQRDPDRPFLLMLHHKAPHMPWRSDEKHADLFADVDVPEPATFHDDAAAHSDAWRFHANTIEHHLNEWMKWEVPEGLTGAARKSWLYQAYVKAYLRSVAAVDDNVGRVLDYLDASDLTDNTVVVYTSDQGFFVGEHGLFDKRYMYEESLRMPLLVRYPRDIQPGSVNTDMVLNLDFAPTFLDLAQLDAPETMQGQSLRPLLANHTSATWRSSMYYHYSEAWLVEPHYGLRTGRYKLMHFYHGLDAWELYDLENDPYERTNVYQDPAYANVVYALKAELESQRQQVGDADLSRYLPPPNVEVDHRAVGHPVRLRHPYASRYTGGGEFALTDGVRAPERLPTVPDYDVWQGFHGEDLDAVVDLGSLTPVQRIVAGFLQNQDDWIFLPDSVAYAISSDGQSFETIGVLANPFATMESGVFRHAFVQDLEAVSARYVRVRAYNIGVCPPGHRGAGEPAWLFADEIIVE